MKTTRMFFTLVFCLSSTVVLLPDAYAQTEKGSMLLGGNASIGFSSQQNNKRFGASISPQIGFFVANRLALGANIYFNYSSYSSFTSRYISAGIGPFVRYYVSNTKVVPFLEAKGGFSRYRNKYEEQSGRDIIETQNSAYGNIGVGLAYFITPSVGLESILSYNINRLNSYNTGSLNLNIGFQVYFSRNKE